jgi:hypothetical protein
MGNTPGRAIVGGRKLVVQSSPLNGHFHDVNVLGMNALRALHMHSMVMNFGTMGVIFSFHG